MWMWKKEKGQLDKHIEFNINELRSKINRISPIIYDNKASSCLRAVREIIETAKNIKLVTVHKIGVSEDIEANFLMTKGAIACLDDLLGTFDKLITDEELKRKTGEKPGVRTFIRTPSPAGASDY